MTTLWQQALQAEVRASLREDVGNGDISAALLNDTTVHARLICREPAVLCGRAWFEACFLQLAAVHFDWQAQDGDWLSGDEGDIVCRLQGSLRAILSAERCGLNFLQTLSATATAAHHWQRLATPAVTVVDTRKTLPLLRRAQKYAVRIGGAHNQRLGLFDSILIKENHIVASQGIAALLAVAFARVPPAKIQIEVRHLDELQTAVAAGAIRILLDNFSLVDLQQAVALAPSTVELEASGGIDETTIAAVAATGVDRISVGAMTKNIKAVDFSLLVEENVSE